jgi:hypothetical protein
MSERLKIVRSPVRSRPQPQFFISLGDVQLTKSQWRKVELIPGWLDYTNAHLMLAIAGNPKLNKSGNILELGTFYGKSAALLSLSLKDFEQITCIDTYGTLQLAVETSIDSLNQNEFYKNLTLKRFQRFFRFAGKTKPNILIGTTEQILPNLNQKFRIIHVDAGHTYEDVKYDITNSIDKLHNDGMIIFDDYGNKSWPGVAKAINEAVMSCKIISVIDSGKL